MLTGVIGGLAPAIAARRTDRIRRVAGSTARVTRRRTSTVLVVAQVTLSVVLLVGAGLLMKSFLRILPSDPGFAIENRATLSVALHNQSAFPDSDGVASRRFVRDVEARLRAVRGVRDVAAMTFLPLTRSAWVAPVDLPGMPEPAKPFTAYQNYVTPNFFDLMRIPIARGRAFGVGDNGAAERVAIVNATAAARWWPNENAIGRQIVVQGRERFAVTVIGVARDIRLNGTDTRIRPEIYYPMAQGDSRNLSFIVHTTADPRALSRELQRAIWSVAPHLAIATTTDLATIAAESVGTMKFFSWAMSAFAIAAVTLSALAVYALLAFAVTQRRREIGIRLALGATPAEVAAMVVRTAFALGATGVILGVLSARGLSRFLASILLEVSATDAGVYMTMGAAALVVATAAATIPACHAVRIDPVKSLRE
jgi:predicted permease